MITLAFTLTLAHQVLIGFIVGGLLGWVLDELDL